MNIAFTSLEKGINKLNINKKRLNDDLENSWEILTEAIQTVIRKNLIPNGYELMKDLSRGKTVDKEDLSHLIDKLEISEQEKIQLKELSPQSYIGLADKLARDV
jgi:adenylosuccinate lyase